METITATQETAAAFIADRDARRAACNGWLVPPPIAVEHFSRARMEEPKDGRTVPYPNKELSLLQRWLLDTASKGGTRADLFRVFQAWQPTHRAAKLASRDLLDQLCLRADAREMELASKLDEETRAERHVSMFKSRVAQAETEERSLRAELAAIIATRDDARRELAAAERRLREQGHAA